MNRSRVKIAIFYALVLFIALSLCVLLFFVFYNYKSIARAAQYLFTVLRPLIIGGIVAYLLKSTCNYFERTFELLWSKKKSRLSIRARGKISGALAIIASYIVWGSALALLLWIVVPQFARSITRLAESFYNEFPEFLEMMSAKISELLGRNEILAAFFGDSLSEFSVKFTEWAGGGLVNLISDMGGRVISVIFGAVTAVKDIAIGLIFSVLVLANRKMLLRRSKILIRCFFNENAARAIEDEFVFADRIFSGFFAGKILDSALIGLIYYVVLAIIKVPYAPLVSVICGVANIIPFFGPFIGAVPSAIIIFSEQPVKVIFFVIFVTVMQIIDGNIIEPHIVGGNIHMSGFGVLFAVVLFGGLFGFPGLLIGVPVFAVIYDIIRKVVRYTIAKRDSKTPSADKTQ